MFNIKFIINCEKCGKDYELKDKDNAKKEICDSCEVVDRFNFIEVCAGAGGLSTGLIKSGFSPLLLNDKDKDCIQTLKENHPDCEIFKGNMTDINWEKYIGKIELLTGGVPCQSFSQAGKRKGLDDPRGDLLSKFIEIVEKVKPKTFMIENVKGLINHNKGETFKNILKKIESSDFYDIFYKVLDASKYGVPQKRERVFIIGVKKGYKNFFKFPQEEKKVKILREVLTDIRLSECAQYSEEKKELFKNIPQGGCWIDLPIEIQKKYLGKSFYSGGGKRGILYRLSLDKPSLTLLCSPSQKQTERCHPLEERPLSIAEYARIQTFPDSYIFKGSMSSKYRQIGNAVPVVLAEKIGQSLIDVLRVINIKNKRNRKRKLQKES